MSLNVEGNDCPKLCNITDTYMIKTQPIRASTSRYWISEIALRLRNILNWRCLITANKLMEYTSLKMRVFIRKRFSQVLSYNSIFIIKNKPFFHMRNVKRLWNYNSRCFISKFESIYFWIDPNNHYKLINLKAL